MRQRKKKFQSDFHASFETATAAVSNIKLDVEPTLIKIAARIAQQLAVLFWHALQQKMDRINIALAVIGIVFLHFKTGTSLLYSSCLLAWIAITVKHKPFLNNVTCNLYQWVGWLVTRVAKQCAIVHEPIFLSDYISILTPIKNCRAGTWSYCRGRERGMR